MVIHRLYIDGQGGLKQAQAGAVTVSGEEARHAVRVKRVGEGDAVELLDGAGTVAQARVEGSARVRHGEWELRLRVGAVRRVEPVRPRVEVWSALPKGPRVAELIEGLSQVGAAAWRGLDCARSVSVAGEQRMDRLRRVAAESSKQCGRAWLLEIGEPARFEGAVRSGGAQVVIADVSGGPYERSGAESIRLLVGPEGGWAPEELGAAREGAVAARFGPHVMRVETAAVVAAAMVLDVESRDAETGKR